MTITNLIIALVISNCSDFAKRLELPLRLPLRTNEIATFEILGTYPTLEVSVLLTNKCSFHFLHGRVSDYRNPRALQVSLPSAEHFRRKAIVSGSKLWLRPERVCRSSGTGGTERWLGSNPPV